MRTFIIAIKFVCNIDMQIHYLHNRLQGLQLYFEFHIVAINIHQIYNKASLSSIISSLKCQSSMKFAMLNYNIARRSLVHHVDGPYQGQDTPMRNTSYLSKLTYKRSDNYTSNVGSTSWQHYEIMN